MRVVKNNSCSLGLTRNPNIPGSRVYLRPRYTSPETRVKLGLGYIKIASFLDPDPGHSRDPGLKLILF